MVSKYANQVSDGMDVVDTNEEKIGTVQDVYDTSGEGSSSGGGYLQIPTGFLGLGKEHHIPFSAITNVRDNQIYLNVAKDRLNELGYDAAPIEKEDTFDGDMVDRTTTVATDTTLPARDVARRDLTTDGARKLQLREEELVPYRTVPYRETQTFAARSDPRSPDHQESARLGSRAPVHGPATPRSV